MKDDKIWTITEVNSVVKTVLEGALAAFWMKAEIGTMTVHTSGHVYMVLKDEKSQLKAVIWKGAQAVKTLKLATGSELEVFGNITVYEPRGEYQFTIKDIRPLGLGDLQRKFEEIKNRLQKEGFFDSSRKKKIPMLPRKIGVITSPTGAAIQDFLNIINRRFPDINIQIYPSAVQGIGAEKELIKGLRFFNRIDSKVDVLVLMRGGGSMEDLWPFNDETLAMEIAASKIPVISAVGHEIDFTISDFVADLRVPTPSAAAELVIAKQDELTEKIKALFSKLRTAVQFFIERKKRMLEKFSGSYVFKDPLRIIFEKQQTIDEMRTKLKHITAMKYERDNTKLQSLISKLQTLNPMAVLGRGYSILINKATNSIIASPDIKIGSLVTAILKEGKIELEVKETSTTQEGR